MSTTSNRNSYEPRSKFFGLQTQPDTTEAQLGLVSENLIETSSSSIQGTRAERIQLAQETIFKFLLEIVKEWSPEEVLLEFKRLFLHPRDSARSDAVHAVHKIVFSSDEAEFRNTLKRCCYILMNNWDAARHYKAVQELIHVFQDPTLEAHTISPTLKRLRRWIKNFRNSRDYEELKLFIARYEKQPGEHWISRYTSYLLVPQYVDLTNPIEQREAARALSRQLKDRFKFDLAMYIARSQSAASSEKLPRNPTALGDNVVHLIKTIVARRGHFSYTNLANIFVSQIQNLSYKKFKQSLQKYLLFSVEKSEFSSTLHTQLSQKLEALYSDYDDALISDALMLRTCNRVIEYLTTENKKEPSPLFILLLSHGSPMTLVIVLLKLVLVCSSSRSHLEAQVAELIRYYENYPEEDCQWVVNFLEIFNVTFAIHAENVQYNLVKMWENKPQTLARKPTLDDYRIFSQMKSLQGSEPSGENFLTDSLE